MVVVKAVHLLVDNHRHLGVSLQWVTRLVEISVRIDLLSDVAMRAEGESRVEKMDVAHLALKRRRK
jgi:hypothetical protein